MQTNKNKLINIVSIALLIIVLASLYIFSPDFRGVLEEYGITDVFNTPQRTENDIEVHIIDVGQGDSILINSPDYCVLVDAGPNSSQNKLVSYLKAEKVSRLDCLVLTHPHEDHIGGADLILETFETDTVLMPDCPSGSAAFENLLDAIEKAGLSITIPKRGDTFSLGDMKFTVLAPGDTEYKETNDYSIVLKLEYGSTAFMLTGDAEALSENEIIDYFGSDYLKCDVLKAGHHGSSTSNSEKFVKAVSPKYAAISCELDNSYGHPHKEVRTLFEELEIEYLRTDYDSNIVFVSDGNKVFINK